MSELEKILLALLMAIPNLFTDVSAITEELKTQDPEGTKVASIAAGVGNLATAVTATVAGAA